ncbi:glycopeptide antibiotics resistance protein [Paenibacillus turicensis]|uniref:Glycopeptide antibiotics resistance protein n=1 Tax=Paenibacillus turicensis TaxID=160487 RepID=A0ABS4FX41_9BACL|nr:glycopeptide antibiotics resistance protein [Paenibacillus turicensis]
MLDLIMIGTLACAILLCYLFLTWCGRLTGEAEEDQS